MKNKKASLILIVLPILVITGLVVLLRNYLFNSDNENDEFSNLETNPQLSAFSSPVSTTTIIGSGASALDLYRKEKNLPHATVDDMMAFYTGKVTIEIDNLGDGEIIEHNLGGYVTTKFIDQDGQIIAGVFGEKIQDDLNHVTFRTPVLDEIINQLYSGKLICEKY